jgi:hypothetical protein
VLDVEGGAKRVERMFASCGPLAQAKEPIGELFSIIGLDGANVYWADTLQVTQKPARIGCRLCIEDADEDPPRRPINGSEKTAPTAFISHLGQVFHVDVSGFVGFEATVFWSGDLGLQVAQVPHTVTTQASIQPRPRDIRVQELTNDSQKIIERDLQCRAQRNCNGLLGRLQRCLQPMRRVAAILDAVALAPLVDGLPCYPITGSKNCPCILANFNRRADIRGRRRLLVQDGSAWSHLVPNVPQNRSCREQGGAPTGNVIIRDGTAMRGAEAR